MRIALVTRRFDAAGGGTERDLIVTARLLSVAGHRISIFADEIRTCTEEFEVQRLGRLPIGGAVGLWLFATRVASKARRDGAELVLSFARILGADILRSGGGAHSSYLRAARRWQSPAAATAMLVSPYHRMQVLIERAGFNSPRLQQTIAVSELVRGDLFETFRVNSDKLVTLYNGVDLERFSPNRDTSLVKHLRREFKIPENLQAIAFVGNGFARKGLNFLLESWPALNPAAALVVVGSDRSIGNYRHRTIKLGIEQRVIFLGPVRQIERVLACVDGLAFPSLFEPFGNVVLEAMAAGLPVLCSRWTGAAEVLPDEFSELVVNDPTDKVELISRLNLLLRMPSDAGGIARATAERYRWHRHGKELLRIIQKSSSRVA
jgi:UDP-glucose:(heptosyl)LPS alpha-1,3-glucosyltransferase